MSSQTIAVSFINVYGFCVVTTHYGPTSVRLRVAEIERQGYTASVAKPADAKSEDAQPRRNARRRPRARKAAQHA